MRAGVHVTDEKTMCYIWTDVGRHNPCFLYLLKYLPTKLSRSERTTAGPMTGKTKENVDANITAKTQALIANVGLYVRG